MKRKHHISGASYQMLFNYLEKFLPIDNEGFHPHLKKTLIGYWCDEGEEELHKEGQICKKAWFITKGMVYLYFIEKEKANAVFTLFRAGEIAIIPDSFMNGNPSTCYINACPGTELLEISKQDLNLIHETFPQSLILENAILASIPEKARERDTLFWLEPKERILTFFDLYPELYPNDKTVKLLDMHIASYLHIDRFRYSRYKNELFPKKVGKSWQKTTFKRKQVCKLDLKSTK